MGVVLSGTCPLSPVGRTTYLLCDLAALSFPPRIYKNLISVNPARHCSRLPARASLPATLSLARRAGQWQAGSGEFRNSGTRKRAGLGGQAIPPHLTAGMERGRNPSKVKLCGLGEFFPSRKALIPKTVIGMLCDLHLALLPFHPCEDV